MYLMPAGHLNRSADRRVAVAFRLSIEDRARLQAIARDQGISVQTYLERVALGHYTAQDRPHGPLRQTPLPIETDEEDRLAS